MFNTLFTGLEKQTTKICNKCGKDLLLTAYTKASGGNYLRSECKSCERALGKIRAQLRKENALPSKDYTCPICNRDADEVSGAGGKKSGEWCCDHNHVTNKFRGWLCHSCNRALGNMNDDIKRLEAAITYLKGQHHAMD